MGRYDPKTPSSANSLNFLLAVVFAGLGYASFYLGPYYWPLFKLRGMMNVAAASGYREFNNDIILKKLLEKAKDLDLECEERDFVLEREPLTWEELRDLPEATQRMSKRRGKSLTISYQKFVDAKWPFIDKWTELDLNTSKTADLSLVTW